ncbi:MULTISPECIES: hypothetical protein [unclassified Pseudomonas]|uniref:hypothetical protein n=1 Tax=unclassified Pseudomonas TaxID=196821 RepID=UPI002AC8E8A8|nr:MULTISPECIES: hypothetical protein [unclassified Pseudomonas]MEB0044697.1 hypothetical protein [Pseudomonas sp. Dout3]MEB0096336.1 hypothetical protein [Pseudomonas sp. DC1.2]WPX59267.1 hypothetical protein RHM68_01030 [Pseudomonas sp. DC1.2]
MASANKQQKRATRAKTKAKQNRTQRAVAPVELDPNDDRIDFESVDLTELFKTMIDAEKTNQQALCKAFLEDPLLALVYEQEGEEGAMDFILAALIEYRQWSTEADEASALAWIESPAFQADYVAASDAIAAQTQPKAN